jgi:F0F1-type ATP synthase delta subunit
MKYSASLYAKALAQAVAEAKGKDLDVIEKNFLALVRRNGDEGSLRKIVEQAGRMIRKTDGIKKVTIRSARPLGAAQEKLVNNLVHSGDVVEKEIDPELIAGVRIVMDDELQFDGSLKGKLDALFNNI